jgi:hypothetical protein
MGLGRRADTYVELKQFAQAKPDLEKVLQLRPEDFNAEERLRFVNAKLAPPPVATPPPPTPPPTPTPTPPPAKLLTRANVFIAMGALVVLFIVIIVIVKIASTKRDY